MKATMLAPTVVGSASLPEVPSVRQTGADTADVPVITFWKQLTGLRHRAGKPSYAKINEATGVGKNTIMALFSRREMKSWATVEPIVHYLATCIDPSKLAVSVYIRDFQRWWYEADCALKGIDVSARSAIPAMDDRLRLGSHGSERHAEQGVSWPRQVGSIPSEADCYQHRELTEQLQTELAGGSSTVVLTQVLSGLGGIGKTQLAAKHARQAWNDQSVDLVAWVNASSRETIIATYAYAAAVIDPQAANVADTDRQADLFLAWLQTTERRWLVVLDDLAAPGHLQGLWPPANPCGRTLITTRRRDTALAAQGRRLIDVGLFTEPEATNYLAERLHDRLSDDPHVLDESAALVTDLGLLPLAIAQATAYIRDRLLTCAQYRRSFHDRRTRLSELFPEHSALPDDHRTTVATTWSLSIDLADQLTPAGLARPAMQLTSLLDPNGIPGTILTAPATLAYLTAARGAQPVTASEATAALRCLDRLSLVTHDPASPTHTVRIHSLAQRATREQTHDDQANPLVRVAASSLLEAWPDTERDGIGTIFRLNTSALLDHAGTLIGDDEAFTVLLHVSSSLIAAGDEYAALQHAHFVKALAELYVGRDHPSSLRARTRLGRYQLATQDLVNAVTTLRELHSDLLRLLGPAHESVFDVTSLLAEARGEAAEIRDEAADAAAVVAELEGIMTEMIKLGKPISTHMYAELAGWRHKAGDGARAVSDYRDLFADCADEFGPDDPTTLDVQHGMAQQFGAVGDHEAAVEELNDLIPRMQQVYGHDDLRTMSARRQLAKQLAHSGDRAAALAELQSLDSHIQRIHGHAHYDSLYVRKELAHQRALAGDHSGAIKAYQQLLDDRVQILGRDDDPSTLSIRLSLAQSRQASDGDAVAAAAFAELVPDMIRVHGPCHRWTLLTREALANALARSDDPHAAAAAYQELRIAQEQVLGPDHHDTLSTRLDLAVQLDKADDDTALKPELEDLIPRLCKVFGPDDPTTLWASYHLAWSRFQTGESAVASADLEDLVPRMQQILGVDHPDTLNAWTYLAWCRGDAGEPAAAVATYLDLLVDCLPTLGAQHAGVVEVVQSLVHWHRMARSGEPDPADTSAIPDHGMDSAELTLPGANPIAHDQHPGRSRDQTS